jgi:type IV pilus assembly protein PilX
MSFARKSGNTPRAQRGAVLVTSMLLLMVLTIIGVTVMQMSRMQERMAGNSRDVSLAFQAAEGALRNAELYIESYKVEPVTCSETPCEVWQEQAPDSPIANKDADWWDDNGQAFDLESFAGVKEPPTAVVEELRFVRTDGGVVEPPEDGRNFYQVTSRSTGGSGQAEVVLQTTYTKKF